MAAVGVTCWDARTGLLYAHLQQRKVEPDQNEDNICTKLDGKHT